MNLFKTNIGRCMFETESDMSFIDAVAVHLFVVEKDTIPSAISDVGFWKTQKKHVTVTQRKINILMQETDSRTTYPGWSQQSSVIRGQERTRSVLLGLHRILLI